MTAEQVWRWLTVWSGVPVWGMFLLFLVTLVKTYPIIQRNLLDAREKRESRYSIRIRDLEEAVVICQRTCEADKEEMRKEIRELNEKLVGLRRQHVQEQISLVAAIIESVDNPMLKQMLNALQSVQRTLPAAEVVAVGEVTGDAAKQP